MDFLQKYLIFIVKMPTSIFNQTSSIHFPTDNNVMFGSLKSWQRSEVKHIHQLSIWLIYEIRVYLPTKQRQQS